MSDPININISHPDLYSPIYRKIISDKSRYLVMYGGRDSAKSYTAQQHVLYMLLSEKYCKVVFLRKIYADIKDSQTETLWSVIQAYKLEKYFKYTKSPLEITCLLNGNKVLCRGLDKSHKLKSINSPTVVHIEEADEIQYEDYLKTDTSIRGPKGATLQLILTFNPENEDGWINDEFFPAKGEYEKSDGSHTYIKSPLPNTTILHTTYKDNEFCPEERGLRYERLSQKMADSNYFRVYCLGLWGNALKGLVFDNVKYRDRMPDMEHRKVSGYGLDFGFTNDPTAIVECCLAHGELWVEEIVYKTDLINVEPKSEDSPYKNHSIEYHLKKNRIKKDIVADSAEPKSIKELKLAGFSIKGVKKGKGSIEASIAQMKEYTINICGSSPNLRKEFKSYKYEEHKADHESEFKNKPIDMWNHCFSAETNIFTNRGNVRIDSLKDSDKILTSQGFKSMKWHRQTGVKQIYLVKLSNGSQLKVTGNHNIFTSRGKVRVDALSYGDILLPIEDNEDYVQWLKSHSMESITEDFQNQKTTLIENTLNAKVKSTIETFMNFIMGLFQKATRYTIKILMLLIIQLITFLVYPLKNIVKYMLTEQEENAQTNKESILRGLDQKQRNGILQRRGENGTLTMLKESLEIYQRKNSHVPFVASPLNLKLKPSFALTNASQNLGEIRELMTLKEFAHGVKKNFMQINIVVPNSVHVVAVLKTTEVAPVYNLEVNDLHEYYANGVLVANCIDGFRYWFMDKVMRRKKIIVV